MPNVPDACVADADDHLPIASAGDHTLNYIDRLLRRELVCLAHHAEQSESMHATPQIKIGQRVDALQIERTVIGKRRRGNDIDACRVLCEFSCGHDNTL
jgi:hypothetical protein